MIPDSPTFDSVATVNDVAACVVRVVGCTSTTALNYEPRATVDDRSCFEPLAGCLDPRALNFNCSQPSSGAAADCATASLRGQPTVHAPFSCAYTPPPPWALLVGGPVGLLALCALLVCYTRRRSVKVDAAEVYVFVSKRSRRATKACRVARRACGGGMHVSAVGVPELTLSWGGCSKAPLTLLCCHSFAGRSPPPCVTASNE